MPSSRLDTLNIILGTGMVPLFSERDFDTAVSIVRALYAGGAAAVEFTDREESALDIFSRLVKEFSGSGLVLGAGSVNDPYTAAMFISAGAAFIVSPSFCEETARLCNVKRVPYIPGCMTVSEIRRAEEFGCEIIKLFPSDTLGPSFISAVRGPLPLTRFMPTGGISPDEEELREWINEGAECVGLGSRLITKEIIANRDFKKLENDTRTVIETIKKLKSGTIYFC